MHKGFRKLSLLLLVIAFSVFCAGTSFALGLDDVKKGYFEDYPADEGYPNIGDAFSGFFSHPKWTEGKSNKDEPVPVFKGVAELNGSNAKFEISFVTHDGNMFINEIYVNGERRFFRPVKILPNMANICGYNTMSDDDLLAAVYLN